MQYYQYDPYGRITNAITDPVNSLTFVGRYFGQRDWDTGFTYFWHRWYDAELGRWISRDPIGIKGGVNLYEYVKNRANLWVDRVGFCSNMVCDENIHIDEKFIDVQGMDMDEYEKEWEQNHPNPKLSPDDYYNSIAPFVKAGSAYCSLLQASSGSFSASSFGKNDISSLLISAGGATLYYSTMLVGTSATILSGVGEIMAIVGVGTTIYYEVIK